MIKIDKGVKIPQQTGKTEYPWSDMAIGDSFYTERKSVRVSAHLAGVKRGWKFQTRKESKGFRIWRIA